MLIVAGVNVANLLLIRGLARRRELSVRAAVGATRRRILQQLATEAMMLAAAGSVLGILVAYLSLSAFLALAPPELPRIAQIAIDARALGFAAAAALAVAVLFGVLPGLQTATIEPAEALRAPQSSTAWATRRYWLRHGLVVAQIAIATLVLSTAGLLTRSLNRMQRLDPGFAAREVLLADVAIPSSRYADAAALQRAMCAWPPTQRRCRASAMPARLSRLHLLAPEGSTPRCSPKDRR
jgi:putative ABC transport system permease protein